MEKKKFRHNLLLVKAVPLLTGNTGNDSLSHSLWLLTLLLALLHLFEWNNLHLYYSNRSFLKKKNILMSQTKAQVQIINDGWISHLCASVSGALYCTCWITVTLLCLTGTLEENRVIVNVISNTCASEKKPITACRIHSVNNWGCSLIQTIVTKHLY